MRRLTTAALAAGVIGLGGCTVMTDELGRDRVAIPVDGKDGSLTSPERVGRVVGAGAPYLDYVLPGLGTAAVAVAGALGYRKGHKGGEVRTEEKYQTAEEWWKEGRQDPVRVLTQPVNPAEVQA